MIFFHALLQLLRFKSDRICSFYWEDYIHLGFIRAQFKIWLIPFISNHVISTIGYVTDIRSGFFVEINLKRKTLKNGKFICEPYTFNEDTHTW